MLTFKNRGIKENDFEKIKQESIKIYNKYDIENKGFYVHVEISNRFGVKTNGNCRITHAIKCVRIAISYKIYENIGMESVIGTLRHEFAHLISYIQTGGILDHGTNFKEICLKLGGHMNKKYGTGKYAQCANSNGFLNKSMSKYKLVCPGCGNVTYRDRLNKNFLNHYVCNTCRTPVHKYEIIQQR